MTQTGWIIAGVVALLAIIVLASFLRRKPEDEASGEAAKPAPLPPQSAPPQAAPLQPAPLQPAPLQPAAPPADPPQTIAAEESPAPAPAPVAAEPIAPEPLLTPEAAPLATAPVTGEEDNLLKLKGVGPKIATLLKAEGITRYAQIAGWSDADIAAIDAKLGSFAGRPVRDNWVDQASLLAAGDTAGYEAKYGKL